MSLLSLPQELFNAIADATLPFGIESLALSSKTAYTRCASQIKRHNLLKKKWQSAISKSSDDPQTIYHGDILRLLYEIAKHPLSADYIEELDMWNRREMLSGGSYGSAPHLAVVRREDVDADFRVDEKAITRIEELVHMKMAPYLEAAGVEPATWWEELLTEAQTSKGAPNFDEAPFAMVSLLCMLPNVRTLGLSPRWHWIDPAPAESDEKSELLCSILDAITSLANKLTPNSQNGTSLANLTTVLPNMRQGYDEKQGLANLQWFMQLPHVTSFYAISCLAIADGYTGIPFAWRNPSILSNIRRMELALCVTDADGISTILQNCPNVEVFKYAHETKWHGCGHDWNAASVLSAVAKYCGGRITDLALTVDNMYGDIENGVTSFHEFSQLRILEVSSDVFCGPPLGSGQAHGMDAENAPLPPGTEKWREVDIPCLATMVPLSLESIEINHEPGSDANVELALPVLLEGFGAERDKRLPNLRTAVLRQRVNEHDADFKELAEKEGLSFERGKTEEENEGEPVRLSRWMRDFERRLGAIETS